MQVLQTLCSREGQSCSRALRAAASQCEMRAWTQTFPGDQPSVGMILMLPSLDVGGLENEEKDVVWVQLQALGEGATV